MKTLTKEKSLQVLEKELDLVFGQYIKQRDSFGGQWINCFVCKKPTKVNESEVLHYIGRANMATRYDEINCNSGCISCNKFDPDHQNRYKLALISKYGLTELIALEARGKSIHKFMRCDLLDMICEYTERVKNLKKVKNVFNK